MIFIEHLHIPGRWNTIAIKRLITDGHNIKLAMDH